MNVSEQIDTVPSILEQTDYNIGIFSFGKAEKPNVDYFNPSLVLRPDGDWLITRRATWKDGLEFGMNDIVAFRLNEDKVPLYGVKVSIPKTAVKEQFEDPRAFYHNGNTYIGCCNFVWYGTKWTGAHQIIVSSDQNWLVLNRYDPDVGNNGGGLGQNRGHEKNWIWFVHEGKLHMVYLTTPRHHVICFDKACQPESTYLTEWDYSSWQHGQVQGSTPKIGGGTPPVRVGDEFITFFHSSTLMENKRRRYHMGVLAFEAKPPFRITKITTEPILSGSKCDIWNERKPPVVFPGGCIYRDGKWLIVGGLNDLKCFWLEMTHEQVQDLLIEI